MEKQRVNGTRAENVLRPRAASEVPQRAAGSFRARDAHRRFLAARVWLATLLIRAASFVMGGVR